MVDERTHRAAPVGGGLSVPGLLRSVTRGLLAAIRASLKDIGHG